MELWELRERQQLPLDIKIQMSLQRIEEWYKKWNGKIYFSFSGGKDSTVLLNLIRTLYPNTPGVFINTGLEYPEIVSFVKTIDNIEILYPKLPFHKVIEKYGYPIIGKKQARFIRDLQNPTPKNEATRNLRLTGYNKNGEKCPSMKLSKKWIYLKDAPFKISEKCCDVMKKEPFHRYVKETGKYPINGVMAHESRMREKEYLRNGCNAFHLKEPISQPLAFWTEQDILKYIKEFNIQYSPIYGDIIELDNQLITTGEKRTGCMFCGFGCHLEKEPNRFQRMKITHPKQYNFCIHKLGLGEVLDYIGVPY